MTPARKLATEKCFGPRQVQLSQGEAYSMSFVAEIVGISAFVMQVMVWVFGWQPKSPIPALTNRRRERQLANIKAKVVALSILRSNPSALSLALTEIIYSLVFSLAIQALAYLDLGVAMVISSTSFIKTLVLAELNLQAISHNIRPIQAHSDYVLICVFIVSAGLLLVPAGKYQFRANSFRLAVRDPSRYLRSLGSQVERIAKRGVSDLQLLQAAREAIHAAREDNLLEKPVDF